MKQQLIICILVVLGVAARPASASPYSTFEFEEDFSLPIVYMSITVDVGGANDPKDKLGLAKVATQMMLRGTQKRSKADFYELINRLGGTIEVESRNEGTIFRAAVLSENLDKFLELLEEALTKPKFTAEELKRVKKETIGAILERKGNDRATVQSSFYRFLYGDHPYGNPELGTQAGVKNINHTDVLNFYARYFGAKSIRLFGTGATKEGPLEKWFTSLTDKLTAVHPEAKPADPVAKPVIPPGRRALLVDKPKATQAQVLLGGAGMRPETPGHYAILLANHSFGGGSFQARMMQELRVKRGWTYGAYNSFRYGREPRHFAMYVMPKSDDTAPSIELAIKLFKDFTDGGITREEYTFARDSLVNNAPFNYDTSKKRLENKTSEYQMDFPKDYYRDFANNIGKVSYEEIGPAVKGFFHPENLVLTVVGDSAKLRGPITKLPGFEMPAAKSYLED